MPRPDRSGLVIGLVVGGGVLLLVIAIMVAIAIPTFLGARKRAQDRFVQSSLRNTLTAVKVLATDTGSYTGLTSGALQTVEPSLRFVEGVPSDAPNVVSFRADGQVFAATALSLSGTCFAIFDELNIATRYGDGDMIDCIPDAFVDTQLSETGWR